MSASRPRLEQALFLVVLLAIWPAAAISAGAARGGIAAQIEKVTPTGLRPDAVVMVRRGKASAPIPADGRMALLAGDQLVVLRPEGRVVVRLYPSQRIIEVNADTANAGHRAGAPNYVVPAPKGGGMTETVARLFKVLMGPADQGEDSEYDAVTRSGPAADCFNRSGDSNSPTLFRIPSLTANEPLVAPGRRRLYVAWEGGVPPFSVTVERASDGVVLADGRAPQGCAVRLPPADLTPGRYRITVTDRNGARLEENNLVTDGEIPAMPDPIAALEQPADVKALYYSSWLGLQSGGAWSFEALQKVAALDCRDQDVADWLSTQGGVACP